MADREITDTERLEWLVRECTYKQLELLWLSTSGADEFRQMIDNFIRKIDTKLGV